MDFEVDVDGVAVAPDEEGVELMEEMPEGQVQAPNSVVLGGIDEPVVIRVEPISPRSDHSQSPQSPSFFHLHNNHTISDNRANSAPGAVGDGYMGADSWLQQPQMQLPTSINQNQRLPLSFNFDFPPRPASTANTYASATSASGGPGRRQSSLSVDNWPWINSPAIRDGHSAITATAAPSQGQGQVQGHDHPMVTMPMSAPVPMPMPIYSLSASASASGSGDTAQTQMQTQTSTSIKFTSFDQIAHISSTLSRYAENAENNYRNFLALQSTSPSGSLSLSAELDPKRLIDEHSAYAKAHRQQLLCLQQEMAKLNSILGRENLLRFQDRESRHEVFKEELYKELIQLMENELSCVVCSEIFIEASVIDCGHTFCGFCITQWLHEKKECPICRKRVTSQPKKHLEMDNFVRGAHALFSEEILERRADLLGERVEMGRRREEQRQRQQQLQLQQDLEDGIGMEIGGSVRNSRERWEEYFRSVRHAQVQAQQAQAQAQAQGNLNQNQIMFMSEEDVARAAAAAVVEPEQELRDYTRYLQEQAREYESAGIGPYRFSPVTMEGRIGYRTHRPGRVESQSPGILLDDDLSSAESEDEIGAPQVRRIASTGNVPTTSDPGTGSGASSNSSSATSSSTSTSASASNINSNSSSGSGGSGASNARPGSGSRNRAPPELSPIFPPYNVNVGNQIRNSTSNGSASVSAGSAGGTGTGPVDVDEDRMLRLRYLMEAQTPPISWREPSRPRSGSESGAGAGGGGCPYLIRTGRTRNSNQPFNGPLPLNHPPLTRRQAQPQGPIAPPQRPQPQLLDGRTSASVPAVQGRLDSILAYQYAQEFNPLAHSIINPGSGNSGSSGIESGRRSTSSSSSLGQGGQGQGQGGGQQAGSGSGVGGGRTSVSSTASSTSSRPGSGIGSLPASNPMHFLRRPTLPYPQLYDPMGPGPVLSSQSPLVPQPVDHDHLSMNMNEEDEDDARSDSSRGSGDSLDVAVGGVTGTGRPNSHSHRQLAPGHGQLMPPLAEEQEHNSPRQHLQLHSNPFNGTIGRQGQGQGQGSDLEQWIQAGNSTPQFHVGTATVSIQAQPPQQMYFCQQQLPGVGILENFYPMPGITGMGQMGVGGFPLPPPLSLGVAGVGMGMGMGMGLMYGNQFGVTTTNSNGSQGPSDVISNSNQNQGQPGQGQGPNPNPSVHHHHTQGQHVRHCPRRHTPAYGNGHHGHGLQSQSLDPRQTRITDFLSFAVEPPPRNRHPQYVPAYLLQQQQQQQAQDQMDVGEEAHNQRQSQGEGQESQDAQQTRPFSNASSSSAQSQQSQGISRDQDQGEEADEHGASLGGSGGGGDGASVSEGESRNNIERSRRRRSRAPDCSGDWSAGADADAPTTNGHGSGNSHTGNGTTTTTTRNTRIDEFFDSAVQRQRQAQRNRDRDRYLNRHRATSEDWEDVLN